jgi:hypothetical protein
MRRSSLAYIPFFWGVFLSAELKWTHQGAIPSRFGLIWFSGFREDLNVIFYQSMPNLHNQYKSAERNISQKKIGIYDKLLLVM